MLTELQVKGAKPKAKPYMVRDDRGLYLRIDASGRKYWILRYWEQKKEHQISLGPYPEISLKDARIKRDEIQTVRAKGEKPLSSVGHSPHVFADVVAEWLKVRMCDRAESYVRTVRIRLNRYILPKIGATPLKQITSADVLQICRSIENLGHDKTARRVKTLRGMVQVIAYAPCCSPSNAKSNICAQMRRPEDTALCHRAPCSCCCAALHSSPVTLSALFITPFS